MADCLEEIVVVKAFSLSRKVDQNTKLVFDYEFPGGTQAEAIQNLLNTYGDEYEWLGYSIDQFLFIQYHRTECTVELQYKGIHSLPITITRNRVGIRKYHDVRIMMRNEVAKALIQAMQDDLEDYELWSS